MVLDIYGASDVGCIRALNEDSFCIYGFDDNRQPGFCILSDGMGGHNAGEVASGCAVRFAADVLKENLESGGGKLPPKALIEAVESANRQVLEMALSDESRSGMGATMVAAYIRDDEAYIANVGDSRAYAYRDKELVQITKDHSIVEEMVASGTISRDEARNHPQKNIITRAIGTDAVTEADIFEYDCMPGDCLLLCSDGLSGMLEDKELYDMLNSGKSAEKTVKSLIESAKDHGGNDNITAICIRFMQEG